MSTYKGIKGIGVQDVAGDAPATSNEGQIWYNTSTGTFKVGKALLTGVWSTANNTNFPARYTAGFGTRNAALKTGGSAPPSPGSLRVESYDGISWTETNAPPNNSTNINVFHHASSKNSPSTDGLIFAGDTPAPGAQEKKTQYWNGTTWAFLSDMNYGREQAGGTGTSSTSALCAGGVSAPGDSAPTYGREVEAWNGTSWTAKPTLSSNRTMNGVTGTATSALSIGGRDYAFSSPPDFQIRPLVEAWNGTNWTAVASLNQRARGVQSFGANNTSALKTGGHVEPGDIYLTGTESYDGTTWTVVPATLNVGRRNGTDVGSTSSAFVAGGYTPPGLHPSGGENITEHYDAPAVVVEFIRTD